MTVEIILASASPRRRELLAQLGLAFKVENSDFDEVFDGRLSPAKRAGYLALQKAITVARDRETGLVIGADTLVEVDGVVLGKPLDREDAQKMLLRLSGKWHSVYTGVALVKAGDCSYTVDTQKSSVKFKTLAMAEINGYIQTGEPMDKAGAYGIQGKGSIFVEQIRGCYFNIVGLPLFKLNVMLESYGINVLE